MKDVSVSVFNLSITDSLYPIHKKKTVFLEEVNASISVLNLWNEEIRINGASAKGGEINLFVQEDGYTNNYVFKPIKKEIKEKRKKKKWRGMAEVP